MVVSKRTVLSNFKTSVWSFLESSITDFMLAETGVVYYAIALDVEQETGTITLSYNTEFDYHKKLMQFQDSDELGKFTCPIYQESLRFTSETWHYQAVSTVTPLEACVYAHYYGEHYDDYIELIGTTLRQFKETSSYAKIPKSSEFEIIISSSNPVGAIEETGRHLQSITGKNLVCIS